MIRFFFSPPCLLVLRKSSTIIANVIICWEVFLTMSINTFVYPYPINVFIISRLGMTVEQFCELHGYKQSTVASWVTRNRAVKTLPCDFLYCLSLSSGWSMDGVYRHLLVLEEKIAVLNRIKEWSVLLKIYYGILTLSFITVGLFGSVAKF